LLFDANWDVYAPVISMSQFCLTGKLNLTSKHAADNPIESYVFLNLLATTSHKTLLHSSESLLIGEQLCVRVLLLTHFGPKQTAVAIISV